jgi:SAM-dependent methyltransferase
VDSTPTASPAPALALDTAESLPECLYCGGKTYDLLFEDIRDRLAFVPGRWAFWQCADCASAMLAPHPRASDLAGFYPPVYSFAPDLANQGRLQRLLAGLEYRLYFKPQYRAQTRKVLAGIGWNGQKGLRLLDVGCGRGLRLLCFRERGFQVHGMDFQPAVVEYLQTQLGIPAVCTGGDNLAESFDAESFDVITGFWVLEHAPSVKALLKNCLQLLRPGGWLAVSVPLVDSVQAMVLRRRWVNVTEAPRHLSLPSQGGMMRACNEAGYHMATMKPDATLACAGMLGLSIFAGGATSQAYGAGKATALAARLLGALTTQIAAPWCLVENYVLRRPACGIFFAQKPA